MPFACPAHHATPLHAPATHLRCLGLGFKAGVSECEAAVVAEQADEGAKGHGLHPVVDLGHLSNTQSPARSGASI